MPHTLHRQRLRKSRLADRLAKRLADIVAGDLVEEIGLAISGILDTRRHEPEEEGCEQPESGN